VTAIRASHEGAFGENDTRVDIRFIRSRPSPPETRLAVLEQYIRFIVNCSDKKIHWVFGAAGVGKSAIMQSVAEFPPFFRDPACLDLLFRQWT
jgi:hypothetical protein